MNQFMMDEQFKNMLREVHSAVIGNEQLGHEGLVKKVDRHDKWINNANLKGAAIVGGTTVIVFIIEWIFRKP